VHVDVDPSGQAVYVTWLDVADRRGTAPAAGATSVNVQVVLRASGDCALRDGAVNAQAAGVSASFPLVTTGPDSLPLEHATGLPQIGNTFSLSIANVENLAPLAILLAGDTVFDPGLTLAAIGAPGCQAYTNLLVTATVPVTFPGGVGAFVLPIPNDPMLVGLAFASQFAALTTKNALGLSTSNGVAWTVGN
jgi:hypothetical protein